MIQKAVKNIPRAKTLKLHGSDFLLLAPQRSVTFGFKLAIRQITQNITQKYKLYCGSFMRALIT